MTVEQAKAALIESADRLDPFRRAAEGAVDLAKRRPGAALGAEFGLGVLLGRSPALRRGTARAVGAYARSKLSVRGAGGG